MLVNSTLTTTKEQITNMHQNNMCKQYFRFNYMHIKTIFHGKYNHVINEIAI